MAKTIRATGRSRASQSLSEAPSYAECLLAAARAVDCSNAPTIGQTESGPDWSPGDPARTAPGVGPADPVGGDHQSDFANTRLGGHAPCRPGLFSKTLDRAGRQPARVGLDVSLSRKGTQGLCLSYTEPAHARVHANDRHRQEWRDGDPAWPGHLENPGNPAIFATRQRRRFLWRLQSPTHLRTVRPAVFVLGHRTDLLARRRTRMQWRGRRVERPVGACLLGATSVYLVGTGGSGQCGLCPLVYDRLCASPVGRRDGPAGLAPPTGPP